MRVRLVLPNIRWGSAQTNIHIVNLLKDCFCTHKTYKLYLGSDEGEPSDHFPNWLRKRYTLHIFINVGIRTRDGISSAASTSTWRRKSDCISAQLSDNQLVAQSVKSASNCQSTHFEKIFFLLVGDARLTPAGHGMAEEFLVFCDAHGTLKIGWRE